MCIYAGNSTVVCTDASSAHENIIMIYDILYGSSQTLFYMSFKTHSLQYCQTDEKSSFRNIEVGIVGIVHEHSSPWGVALHRISFYGVY